MSDRYAKIREALEMGPTPGPWYHGAKNGEHKYCVYDKVCWTDEYGRHGETPNMVVHVSPDDGRYREAAYIAAADPSTIRALLAERDALAAEVERLRETLANLVQEIDDLVSESEGVAGLHLNGDVAEWGDLLPGGPYERLTSLDDARRALGGDA